MTTPLMLLMSALAVAAAVIAVRAWLLERGPRLVICPDNGRGAALDLGLARLVTRRFGGHAAFDVKNCSRWPGKAGCAQDCLEQIEAAPADCLARNAAARWYEFQRCAYCRKPFEPLHAYDHQPALLRRDGSTVRWCEVPPEDLPGAFAESKPVCWDCHVTETFRREHPELVIERPARPRRHD